MAVFGFRDIARYGHVQQLQLVLSASQGGNIVFGIKGDA
jgi:hypothetical protein